MSTKNKATRRPWRNLLRATLGLPAAAALGWFGYSNLFIPHNLPLPPALEGERREFSGRAGRLSYYVAGQGAPLLLVHSVNAAASAYEVRPLFEQYKGSRRVYALDLPGFGFSDRSERPYTPRLFTDAVIDMLDEIARDAGPEPLDALAVSLGSEFLARAASEQPERFRTLALITPTGFNAGKQFYGEPGSTRAVPMLREVLAFPLWARPLFDLLDTPPSARFFLKQTFGSYEAIDQGLINYDYITAHRPDAQHAPFAFVAGNLFSGDIDRVYESLQQPVWLAHGTKGQFSETPNKPALNAQGNWTIQAFPTGALPYFEQPDSFFENYDSFLQREFVSR